MVFHGDDGASSAVPEDMTFACATPCLSTAADFKLRHYPFCGGVAHSAKAAELRALDTARVATEALLGSPCGREWSQKALSGALEAP